MKACDPVCFWIDKGGTNFGVPLWTCSGLFTLTQSPDLNVGILAPRRFSLYSFEFPFLFVIVSLRSTLVVFVRDWKDFQLVSQFPVVQKFRWRDASCWVRCGSVVLQEVSHCGFPAFLHLFCSSDTLLKHLIPSFYCAIALWIVDTTAQMTYSPLCTKISKSTGQELWAIISHNEARISFSAEDWLQECDNNLSGCMLPERHLWAFAVIVRQSHCKPTGGRSVLKRAHNIQSHFFPGIFWQFNRLKWSRRLLADLPFSWEVRYVATTDSNNLSIWGHQCCSRSTCFIGTTPWCVSCAKWTTVACRETGTM